MSEQRHAIDFLRRRYASAIVRDDMDTACRLRLQLDAIMNRARLADSGSAEAPAAFAFAIAPCEAPPQFQVSLPATPVTGLLERRR